jgi:hypothetical protein
MGLTYSAINGGFEEMNLTKGLFNPYYISIVSLRLTSLSGKPIREDIVSETLVAYNGIKLTFIRSVMDCRTGRF